MAAAFGIHLGSSASCLAVYKDGNTEVIANAAGDRTTPAMVAFSDHDKVVGLAAKQGLIRNAKNTPCRMKRLIGLDYGDDRVATEVAKSQCQIEEKDGKPVYVVQHMEKQKLVSPDSCVQDIFELLRDIAQHHGDTDVHDTVLTAPVDYTDKQKQALRDTASKAGFNVLRIISEPAAALVGYDVGKTDHHVPCNALVLRIGGSSSSVTCLSVKNGMYKVVSDKQTSELSGDMFTHLIAQHFAKDFLRQYKCDPMESKRSWNKLISVAETCKHTLTNLSSANASVDSLHEGLDFSASIARARFDMLCSDLLSTLSRLIQSCLEEASWSPMDVQRVVLSGGGTRVPCVVKKVQSALGNAEINSSIPADEVTAVGAAKQAGILLSASDTDLVSKVDMPCISKEIGVIVQSASPTYEMIFSSEHPVPCKLRRTYIAFKPTFKMVVQQGDTERETIAKVVLANVEESAEIEVHFSVNNEGTLSVLCQEHGSGKKCDLVVVNATHCDSKP